MTSKWTGYFKVVSPSPATLPVTDSQEMTDVGAYNNYTWYQRLVQGSASRMTRYREYDLMDNDVEVARALDTIAEEMTGNNAKTHDPLLIEILTNEEEAVTTGTVVTLKAALRRWIRLQKLNTRLFKISRMTIKYGDLFFRKSEIHKQWEYINPKNVIAALVDENDITKVIAWQVKLDIQKPRTGGYGMTLGGKDTSQFETEIVPAREIVRFTLNDDMSDTAPFGESTLRSVYRSHKQKELLEDAIIIYRVQRAPERRVFYIDVGKLPPQRVKTYLEQIKNEIKQKKVPTMNGGQTEVDSVYNPQSMSEDFFFASRPDGRGSRVETLPGGQGLGELADLEYFQRKVWRGLKVPASYMIEQQEGGQIWNDGKVGVAYIQELRFALYIMRLQTYIEETIDVEFKKYLKQCNIHIDESLYRIILPEPSNFGKYRQYELDSALLNTFSTADGVTYLSKRFILKRFMQLSDEEIITNEGMLREEKAMKVNRGADDFPALYGAQGEGGLGGPPLGGGFGGAEMPMMAGGPELGGEMGMGPEMGGEMGAPEGGMTAGGAETAIPTAPGATTGPL